MRNIKWDIINNIAWANRSANERKDLIRRKYNNLCRNTKRPYAMLLGDDYGNYRHSSDELCEHKYMILKSLYRFKQNVRRFGKKV